MTKKVMSVLAWLGNRMVSKENEAPSPGGVRIYSTRRICELILAVVEINLRLPSMLHGRKGFDRIVYAFKNVLTKPVTWLFTNLQVEGTCLHLSNT